MKVHEGNAEQRRSKQQFLKVVEVAQELNVGERSVWRLIESVELYTYRFGNSTRVKRQDLDAYIERSRR
jgi:excisionase family DNA binding protein